MRKLRHRENKSFTQGHTACSWQSQGWKPSMLTCLAPYLLDHYVPLKTVYSITRTWYQQMQCPANSEKLISTCGIASQKTSLEPGHALLQLHNTRRFLTLGSHFLLPSPKLIMGAKRKNKTKPKQKNPTNKQTPNHNPPVFKAESTTRTDGFCALALGNIALTIA